MGGHKPPISQFKPNSEDFHLMTAKIGYVTGGLSVLELEASVEHVLKGGTLNAQGRIPKADELPSMADPELVSRVGMI